MNGHNAIDIIWLQQQFSDLSNLRALTPGGQKQVFAATHQVDGDVVLKIIHPQQDLATTQREVLAVKTLGAPRVPQILDTGSFKTNVGVCFWFREQRVPGQPLSERLRAGPLTIAEVLRLGKQILEILAIAERQQIVHRDVNPRNIILANGGDFWLIDFGLARHLQLQSLTATENVFGKFSPGYAPPEQYRNVKGDIDHRCDLFALGVTLYEAATGANPFLVGVRDMLDVFKLVETKWLPPLLLQIQSKATFADLISALTQRRRDHRPGSVKEALDWMNQICDAEGIR